MTYFKPFVKGKKNDYNDTQAISDAALRPNLRVVRERRRTNSTSISGLISMRRMFDVALSRTRRSC